MILRPVNRSPFPFLDHPGPIAYAHRGGAVEHPENTMRAFQHAVNLGYRYLETDAQATKDGVLVAFHDDRLDRVTDRTGVISELAYDELRRARVYGTDEIPLLADVFEAFPDARINVDAKTGHAVDPLIELIRRMNALDRVCVGSFESSSLARIRKALGPSLCTVATVPEVVRLRLTSFVPIGAVQRWIGRTSTACLQVPVRQGRFPVTDRRFVQAATRIGKPVHVWTIDDEQEMDRLLDLGVDGLMTDRPTLLRGVLQRRGQWVG